MFTVNDAFSSGSSFNISRDIRTAEGGKYTTFYLTQGGRGRDRMLVGFATACEISAYHH